MRIKHSLYATACVISSVAIGDANTGNNPIISYHRGYTIDNVLNRMPSDSLSLRIKIEPVKDDVVAGEMFPIRYTVSNLSSRILRVSLTGSGQPSLYAGLSGDKLRLFVEKPFDALGNRSVTLSPGESATYSTFVLPYEEAIVSTLFCDRSYVLRLRAAGTVTAAAVEEANAPTIVCNWQSEEIRIPIRAPNVHEQEAYEALVDSSQGHRVSGSDVTREEGRRLRVKFWRNFLDQYGSTPYARYVRILLLNDLSRLPRTKSTFNEEPLPPYIELYVSTVSALLNAGVPYVFEVDRNVLETLHMARRWETVQETIQALLLTDPSERMSDNTFVAIVRNYSTIANPTVREHVDNIAESMHGSVVRCVARCAAWKGYRSIPFGRKTFRFLEYMKEWELLELTAERTLEIAGHPDDMPDAVHSVDITDDLIAEAKRVLRIARIRKASE